MPPERTLLRTSATFLFLLALLAMLAPAPAQSQTTNCCVGCTPPYTASYNVTVLPGFNYLVNHLCHGQDNLIDAVLPVVPDGTEVYKWNKATQSYETASTYFGGIGWVDPTVQLPPGEGFILFNPDPSPFVITFRGCPPACPPRPAPTNGCCLVGRVGIGTAAWADLFSGDPLCGTRVSIWNPTNQVYRDYTYLNGTWTPEPPVLGVGASAFVCVEANTNCAPCERPVITTQPLDYTAAECSCVTFTVAATGDPPLTYQWYKGGVPIPGASGTSLTLCPLNLADGGSYWVIVANDCGSVTSRVAVLTVVPDLAPPKLISASVDCPSNKFTLVFDEPVDPLVAGDPSNYVINGGMVFVMAVTVSPDGRTVCLFTSPLGSQTSFGITIGQISDLCGNHADSLTTTVSCACLELLHERLVCATNAPGKLNYSFDLQNNTGVPVKYLYLVPKDDCFTFAPGIVTFSPPLPSGQSAGVNAMITVGTNCPTNLCFFVVALNSNLVQCCSIMHCVDRPNCSDCGTPAQMSIAWVNGSVVISWTGSGHLQCAATVTGPWVDVPGATNPYTAPPPAAGGPPHKFYRVVCP